MDTTILAIKRFAIKVGVGLALLAAVAAPSGAYAQTTPEPTSGNAATAVTSTVQEATDDDDDGFPWGLLGLLGLAGLLGARPHHHEIERVDTTPTTR